MSDVVIQVDSLYKKYRLGVVGTGTIRHDFNRWLHRVVGKPDPYAIVGAPTKSEDRRAKSEGEAPKSEERRARLSLPSPLSHLLPAPLAPPLLSPLYPLLRRRFATTKCGPCATSPSRTNRAVIRHAPQRIDLE